jgi:hypothetical protein
VVIGLAGYAAALGLAAAATLVALLLPPPADLSAARPSAPAATQRSG